jgi:hypothetical protein
MIQISPLKDSRFGNAYEKTVWPLSDSVRACRCRELEREYGEHTPVCACFYAHKLVRRLLEEVDFPLTGQSTFRKVRHRYLQHVVVTGRVDQAVAFFNISGRMPCRSRKVRLSSKLPRCGF